MDRLGKILFGIDRGMRVLELGPAFSPIAPKADGWDVCTVDHLTREELVEKYRHDRSSPDVTRIEQVDVVWKGGPLEAAVPTEWHGTFDACIASHVLEHVPDPVGLLRSLERVLSSKAIVSLAIPDKRRCFDYFKALSFTGELLDAHLERLTRHRVKTVFDHAAYGTTSAGAASWDERPVTDLALFTSLQGAKNQIEGYANDTDTYLDCHAWQFTPASFELVMLELAALEVIDFSIVHSFPTEGVEFFGTLRRGRAVPPQDELERRRVELLVRTVREAGEQALLLSVGASDAPGAHAPSAREVALRARVGVLEDELHTMRTSESWRVTAPLRSFGRGVRQLRRWGARRRPYP
jgi:SAM-dependent methyltransferase